MRSMVILFLIATSRLHAAGAPLNINRLSAPPVLDGDLSDHAWTEAARFDAFIETSPATNIPATIKTVAWLAYDDSAIYVAFECHDPRPAELRAPFVQRDAVVGTDDNVAVFIDTRGDRRTAQEFRTNPRGAQADALFNDPTYTEDFAPDFAYDAASRIGPQGWSTEMRIPFSTLRYSETVSPHWTIVLTRNYPRNFRYLLRSVASGASACLLCHANELRGLENLPAPRKVLATPYATGNYSDRNAKGLTADGDLGADLKWTPSPHLALDATINPDFSQIELDVPQLTVNERFALSLPENRRFFLEASDLFQTPIRAAYTRSITDPAWGARASGHAGATTYTVLLADDGGGGSTIVPGALGSSNVFQDFHSTAAIGRVARPYGRSRAGFLVTAREVAGGGHNRVFGPDFTWRPSPTNSVTAQVLYSSTETPKRPDLHPSFDGSHAGGVAAMASWLYYPKTFDFSVQASALSEEFRADVGFVPRVGVREMKTEGGYKFLPKTSKFRFVRPYLAARRTWMVRDGNVVSSVGSANVYVKGWKNLVLDAGFEYEDLVAGNRMFRQWQFRETASLDLSRRFPRVQLDLRLGDAVDLVNARDGSGGTITASGAFRPDVRSEITLLAQRQWLDLQEPGAPRLFTADVRRLRLVYNIDANRMARLVIQHVDTRRARNLYVVPVAARSSTLNASLLFSWRLNWQTVFYAGYGDDERFSESAGWRPDSRGLFFKITYLLQ